MKVKMSALYYRVSRLVVLPDYQGVGVGKRFLNFMAEYYMSRTKLPFTIITSNPQLVRGNLEGWKITHIGRGQRVDSRNLARPYTASSEKRITVSMRYVPLDSRMSQESEI
jgi:GNAT superfamily N-acetyltransferase